MAQSFPNANSGSTLPLRAARIDVQTPDGSQVVPLVTARCPRTLFKVARNWQETGKKLARNTEMMGRTGPRKASRPSKECLTCGFVWSGRRDWNPRPSPWQKKIDGHRYIRWSLPAFMQVTCGEDLRRHARHDSEMPLISGRSGTRVARKACVHIYTPPRWTRLLTALRHQRASPSKVRVSVATLTYHPYFTRTVM